MKIVGGKYRGRSLRSIGGNNLRPTSARVREAIFNILLHGTGHFEIERANVLDLFCGTGALGIEALSRDASHVIFVDKTVRALRIVEHNLHLIRVKDRGSLWKLDALSISSRLVAKKNSIDLTFIDAPYRKALTTPTLIELEKSKLLKTNARIVVEVSNDEKVMLPPQYTLVNSRRYGDTKILFLVGKFFA